MAEKLMTLKQRIVSLYLSGHSIEKIQKLTELPEKEIKALTSKYEQPHRSKGEEKLLSILQTILPFHKIIEQHTVEGKRYDFYIPKLNLAIEYNGIQHYKQNDLFHGKNFAGIYNLESELKNDILKVDIANKNGFTVLAIPYNIPLNEQTVKELLYAHIINAMENTPKN